MNLLPTIAVGILTGAACAHFAKNQGRNPRLWFFIGFLFGIFGILAVFILPKMKKKVPAPAEATPLPAPKPPAHADTFWYYLDSENERFGPMKYEALQNLFKENKISSQTYVWNEEFEDWKRFEEITNK